MFPIATITWLGAVMLCVALGWVTMGAGRCAWRSKRGGPMKLVAIAAIVGGLYLFFGHVRETKHVHHVGRDIADVVDRHIHVRPHIEIDLDDSSEPRVDEDEFSEGTLLGRNFSVRKFPSARAEHLESGAADLPQLIASERVAEAIREQRDEPNWMLITLGAVLLIGGWLLVRRDGTRPVTFKVLTALGLAATGVILYTLFHAPSEPAGPILVSHSNDRVIKLPPADRETASAPQPTSEPKRPSRAKRPVSRAKRPIERDASIDQLPPRAGGIPVDAELAGSEPAAPAQPEPVKEPAPVASEAPQPAKAPVEPAASEAPSPPSESPAQAPEPAEAPQPVEPAASEAPAVDPPEAPAEAKLTESAPAESKPVVEARKPPSHEPQPVAAPVNDAKPADTKPADAEPKADEKAAESNHEVVVIEPSGPRPSWIDMEGKLNGSVYRVAIKSGLYVEVPECQRALDQALKAAADSYIDDYLVEGASGLVDIPRDYLREHVKRAEYHEVVQSESVGPMHQIHAMLEFDDDARAMFEKRWRTAIVTERLWYVGLGGAAILGLLSTFYGYLRLDMRTGGTHKGRLQLAATLVALIVAAGALLARWTVPF